MRLVLSSAFLAMMLFVVGFLAAGCVTRAEANRQAHEAFLAGESAAMQQEQARAEMPAVTIIGPVQNPKVPWVAGLTLIQALASANYTDPKNPTEIIITRNGESATLDPKVLFNGTVVPLQAGDIIELRH